MPLQCSSHPVEHASLFNSSLNAFCTGLLKRLHPVTSVPPSGPARNYGSHMALSMAIGFLFLGGGSRTFATNDAAAAALVMALYPRLPASTMDHRCHLQVSHRSVSHDLSHDVLIHSYHCNRLLFGNPA